MKAPAKPKRAKAGRKAKEELPEWRKKALLRANDLRRTFRTAVKNNDREAADTAMLMFRNLMRACAIRASREKSRS